MEHIIRYYYVQGSLMEMSENYRAAIRNFRQVLDVAPWHGPTYYALAKCYTKIEGLDSAYFYAREATRWSPERADVHLLLADILLDMNEFDKAAEAYEEAIRYEPDNLQARFMIARIWQRRDPDKAIEHYNYILTNIAEDPDVLFNLFELYSDRGDYKEAAKAMRHLIEIYPDDTDLYQLLAEVYLSGGEYDQALALIDEANAHITRQEKLEQYFVDQMLTVSERLRGRLQPARGLVTYGKELAQQGPENLPESWRLKFYGGLLYYRLNEPDQADDNIRIALMDSIVTAEIWLQAATTYLEQREYTRLIATLSPSAERHREDYRICYTLGMSYLSINELDSAEVHLKQALEQNEMHGNSWGALGQLYQDRDEFGASAAAYQKAIFYEPDNAMYKNNYAYLLAEHDTRLETALEMIRQALEEEPENESFLDTIGWIYYKMGDYKRALRYIHQAVDIGGASPILIEHLGDVYHAIGNTPSAREAYERALLQDPANETLKRKLECAQ